MAASADIDRQIANSFYSDEELLMMDQNRPEKVLVGLTAKIKNLLDALNQRTRLAQQSFFDLGGNKPNDAPGVNGAESTYSDEDDSSTCASDTRYSDCDNTHCNYNSDDLGKSFKELTNEATKYRENAYAKLKTSLENRQLMQTASADAIPLIEQSIQLSRDLHRDEVLRSEISRQFITNAPDLSPSEETRRQRMRTIFENYNFEDMLEVDSSEDNNSEADDNEGCSIEDLQQFGLNHLQRQNFEHIHMLDDEMNRAHWSSTEDYCAITQRVNVRIQELAMATSRLRAQNFLDRRYGMVDYSSLNHASL